MSTSDEESSRESASALTEKEASGASACGFALATFEPGGLQSYGMKTELGSVVQRFSDRRSDP